jgi:thiamine-monophosphate kinase
MAAGEFDLIAAIKERLPTAGEGLRVGSGDDAAVVEDRGSASAITVDAMIEGVHFTLPAFSPEAVGRKSVAMALSDLAAMGALAGEIYVTVGAPADTADERLLALADGLAEAASREGVAVAGGDLVASPVLVLSLTAIGYEADGVPLVTRGGAKRGDAVAVTGELGGAAAALALLGDDAGDQPDAGSRLPDAEREALLARQLHARPRLAAGRALAKAGATAMIDLSDGLGADASHLARSSGCRIELDLARLPVAPGVAAVAGGEREALELAASGGEDFELLAALPADRLDEARRAVSEAGSELTELGYVAEGKGVTLRLPGGGELEPTGFDHRRDSSSGGSAGPSSGTSGSSG